MPTLDDPIHLDMLRNSRRAGLPKRLGLYGLEWGDPNDKPHLRFVRDRFIAPYVDLDQTALEIGAGGGRWTRYLLSFRRVYVVDKHPELLDELARNFRLPHLLPIANNGTDFPDIPDRSVDFVFSFGVFVHLDAPIIEAYLASLGRVVTPAANIVIQYSDKTKEAARRNKGFAENTPDRMRQMVLTAGYTILEENLSVLPHSSIVRFRRGPL